MSLVKILFLSVLLPAHGVFLDNKIPSLKHALAFVEICYDYESGSLKKDEHPAGGPTDEEGGSCHPGDVGIVVEKDERKALTWPEAANNCLASGMRLPTAEEWQILCLNEEEWGLDDMTGNWEWASKGQFPMFLGGRAGMAVTLYGDKDCVTASFSFVASFDGGELGEASYRCTL